MVVEIVENITIDKADRGSTLLGAYSVSRVLDRGGLEASGDCVGELGTKRCAHLGPPHFLPSTHQKGSRRSS